MTSLLFDAKGAQLLEFVRFTCQVLRNRLRKRVSLTKRFTSPRKRVWSIHRRPGYLKPKVLIKPQEVKMVEHRRTRGDRRCYGCFRVPRGPLRHLTAPVDLVNLQRSLIYRAVLVLLCFDANTPGRPSRRLFDSSGTTHIIGALDEVDSRTTTSVSSS